MFLSEHDSDPPCRLDPDMFYSPEDDGRLEVERDIREAEARAACFGCQYRMRCLEDALVHREKYGVWGGTGETERKRFREHLFAEGYSDHDMPHGIELFAALRQFYKNEQRTSALLQVRIEA